MLINNGFSKIGKLGEAVQRMSANALLPRAIAAYNSGAVLPFGKLSLSQAGISNGQETLPWSDLDRVTFANGALLVMRKGKRTRGLRGRADDAGTTFSAASGTTRKLGTPPAARGSQC